MEDKWRKQMQQKLEGHERPLPDLSWDELDRALAANRRQGSLWGTHVWGRRFAAAAAVAFTLAGGGFYYFKSEVENVDTPGPAIARTEGVNDKAETISENEDIKTAIVQTVTSFKQHIRQKRSDIAQVAGYNKEDVKTLATENTQTVDTQETYAAEKKEENLPDKPTPKDKRQDIYKPLNAPSSAGRQGGLIASVYTQNAFANSSGGMGGMTYLPYGDANSEFSNGTNGILENSAPKSVTYDHDYPIKVGVGIRYRINKRWSLATGLTYSYLNSTYEASEKGNSWTGKQSLHYVGLPLAVSYNVFALRRLSLYVTAGGEMQKLVSGKSADNGADISETVRERHLQWSLNAAVGAQYNFTDNVGFYVEPGVVHYIDNGSAVENYYKYKPSNFSLSLGLRLDL